MGVKEDWKMILLYAALMAAVAAVGRGHRRDVVLLV
jgi:hypothetical protein